MILEPMYRKHKGQTRHSGLYLVYMCANTHSGVYLRIPGPTRLRQEDCFKYEDSLGYRLRGKARSCLKTPNEAKKKDKKQTNNQKTKTKPDVAGQDTFNLST